MADTTVHHRICPLCEACCGLEIQVRAGRVAAIRGHDADVLSTGYLCPKAVALKDLHEDPDRLRTPMLKRDGTLRPASWDEAWAEIARRLPTIRQAYGRDAVAVVAGNPSSHKIGLLHTMPRLARALGTRNFFSASTLDQMPRHLASGLAYGHWMSIPVPDIARTELLVVLGANPVASNGSMWTVPDFRGKARALQARGGRLVVIDPRRTETAAIADTHWFIRPGADAFLLAGLVHTLFDEELVRLGAVDGLVAGVDAVRAAVAPFAAETVAPRCGIEAAAIRDLARTLARTPRACVYARIGTCTQEYGTLATWLVDVLNTLTGHLDQPGGTMFPQAAAFAANTAGAPGRGRGVPTAPRHHSRVSGAPEVMGELPIGCLAEEIDTPGPGQVRALITVATNPVLSAPNGPRLARALDGLEFMVSLDIYVNETTRHADVILPAPSPLEDWHYDLPYPQMSWRNHARWSGPVFPRADGQPEEWETLLRLGAVATGQDPEVDADALDAAHFRDEVTRRFGEHAAAVLQAGAAQRGPERWLDLALRTGPHGDGYGRNPDGLTLAKVQAATAAGGIDLGPLMPRMPDMLRTPSGRIELAPEACLADLTRVAADLSRPRPGMVVIGRRDVRSNNSWMHNLPVLAKGPQRCTALVHPEDATRLGLRAGAEAELHTTVRGEARSIRLPVELSADLMPGVVSVPHGWGHDLPGTRLELAGQRPGVNLNALLDEAARDPLSGNAVLSGVAVDVRPVTG